MEALRDHGLEPRGSRERDSTRGHRDQEERRGPKPPLFDQPGF